jgi:hypothetical protein
VGKVLDIHFQRISVHRKSKGKAILVQAWTGPEGSMRLRP